MHVAAVSCVPPNLNYEVNIQRHIPTSLDNCGPWRLERWSEGAPNVHEVARWGPCPAVIPVFALDLIDSISNLSSVLPLIQERASTRGWSSKDPVSETPATRRQH